MYGNVQLELKRWESVVWVVLWYYLVAVVFFQYRIITKLLDIEFQHCSILFKNQHKILFLRRFPALNVPEILVSVLGIVRPIEHVVPVHDG